MTDPRLENRVRPTNPFIEFRREEIDQSLYERFERIVRKHPTSIAVKTDRQTVTYDALNKEANRLARAIRSQRNASIRNPAAVLVEQGPQAIAALFGVLKAGRIYVPVDPGHACARVACMLEDSQASLIVTDERNLPLAQELSAGKTPLLVLEQSAMSVHNALGLPGRSRGVHDAGNMAGSDARVPKLFRSKTRTLLQDKKRSFASA